MSPLWPVLGIIVVGGVLLWAFAGVVSLAFHIGEFVAVGAIAGWLGYKLGHARGRRRAPDASRRLQASSPYST